MAMIGTERPEGELHYYEEEYSLTADKTDLRAHTTDVYTWKSSELNAETAQRLPGSTLESVNAVISARDAVIAEWIANGDGVQTGIVTIMPGVMGVKEGGDQHKVYKAHLNFHSGRLLKEASALIRLHRVDAKLAGPFIEAVEDGSTGAMNESLTIGEIAIIIGRRIRIAGEGDVGIFFVNPETEAETPITARLAENTPSRISFKMPAVAAGVYRVRIRTKYSSGNTPLKDARSYDFSQEITVLAGA